MLLFLAIAGGLVSLWLVALTVKPLVERGVVTADEWQRVEDESTELLARRDRLLAELRDIEFEAAMNKIDPRDLAELRARYEAEAVSVVRALDERAEEYDDRIEADVEGARKKKAKPEPVVPEAPAEAEPEPEPVVVADVAVDEADGCFNCGEPLPADARFCDGCGAQAGVACPDCGAANRGEARFCKSCGTSMGPRAVEESA